MAKRVENPKSLLVVNEGVQTPQAFTDSWADLGPILPTQYADELILRLGLNYKGSSNLQCRIKEYTDVSESVTGSAFIPQIETVGASKIDVEDQYIEFNTEGDKNVSLKFDISGMKFAQFQIKAGTIGPTAASADEAFYSLIRQD